MLSTYYQVAVKSPCHKCKTMRDKERYPDCGDWCQSINVYLKLIGDKPREAPKEENLSQKYPPLAYAQNQKERCTPEEFKALSARLKAKKAELKITSQKISDLSNIPVWLVRCVIAGSQKRIIVSHYNKFVDWLESV